MIVIVLPPNESFNKRVSLLSLYGTWLPKFFSLNMLIQLPRASNDLFIFAPSYMRRHALASDEDC